METLPATQQVLKVLGANEVTLQDVCPLPVFEDDEILVRVRCVSINPVDVKMLDLAPHVGATAGCEFSGDVVAVGSAVRNKRLREGVAVFGCVCGNHPSRPDNGAYASFVAVAGDLVYLLPPHLSYSQGASLGAALPTTGLAIYSTWPLQPPYTLYREENSLPSTPSCASLAKETQYVLVYGGSTSSGAMALQMLRKSGIVPVSTCSPSNFAMVKARGAEEVFDYHSPTCGDDIRRYTDNSLAYVLDCIADLTSMKICYAAIRSRGGRYMGLNPFPIRGHTRRDVRPDYVLVYTIFGKQMGLPRPFGKPARPKDRAFAEQWYHNTQSLVDTPGAIQAHPIDHHSDGLVGVLKGLDRMRKGHVSAVKLVYELP
jgi:aspyridone synthetase trans-acting enoyl reductase